MDDALQQYSLFLLTHYLWVLSVFDSSIDDQMLVISWGCGI